MRCCSGVQPLTSYSLRLDKVVIILYIQCVIVLFMYSYRAVRLFKYTHYTYRSGVFIGVSTGPLDAD